MTCDAIETKFGAAKLNVNGYYVVSAKNEHHGKYLHKLIIEDYYNVTLPDDWVVHHDDGDPLNNEVWNLIPMPKSEHSILHNSGENNPMYGKKHSFEKKMKMSLDRNSTGYFRVNIHKSKKLTQGFMYRYQYYDENGKRISIASTDINELQKKVEAKGLIWKKL